jgi:hypothetical protein
MNSEQIAYWFFRLNGCLTLTNFVVHDDSSPIQRTDADILAVRFPYRHETAGPNPLLDHAVFRSLMKIGLFIAEIKTGRCNLNGPWTNPAKGNMNRVLSAIGIFKKDDINNISSALYENSYFEDEVLTIRLFAFGQNRNTYLHEKVVQITWPEVADFFYDRFSEFGFYKRQHEQWDECGRRLFEISRSGSKEDYSNSLLKHIGVL